MKGRFNWQGVAGRASTWLATLAAAAAAALAARRQQPEETIGCRCMKQYRVNMAAAVKRGQ
ncbi:hypothetical protein [Stenotrophomonas maltophilia]|uniref:Secreted protein n=1 Tax=Stenotrophomonas maltophilia TaxID=40324 RepID=A0AAJ2JES6_STEMA|nr:hypothetical protein [Stenotrophomonas maltophilia]MDT3468638.1 hypothetical protein [Stenotrophomonas maltophilia]